MLDLVTQIRDVVFVRCIFSSGNPRGSGFWKEGYMGWSGQMGRSVYEQPGNEVDEILSQQGGFQVSKGRRKGSKRKWAKGKQKARGLLSECAVTYSCTYECLNDCQLRMQIIIAGINVVDNLNCV